MYDLILAIIACHGAGLAFSEGGGIRLYGKVKALSLAQRYEDESTASGDHQACKRWETVAVVIGALIVSPNTDTDA